MSSTPMLDHVARLRVGRFLAALALLVLVGLGQHVHTARCEPSSPTISAMAQGDDIPDSHVTAADHCGLCHVARAMLPVMDQAHPALLAPDQSEPRRAGLAGIAGEPPARPPKPSRTA